LTRNKGPAEIEGVLTRRIIGCAGVNGGAQQIKRFRSRMGGYCRRRVDGPRGEWEVLGPPPRCVRRGPNAAAPVGVPVHACADWLEPHRSRSAGRSGRTEVSARELPPQRVNGVSVAFWRWRGGAAPRLMREGAKRPRISVDITPGVRRRLRLAAAKRDLAVGQYVRDAPEERLREDLGGGEEGLLALTARTDPILAALWDNVKDAAYNKL